MGNPLMSDEPSSSTKPTPVRSRPQPGYWVMILLFGGMGIFSLCLPFTSSTYSSLWERFLFLGIFAPCYLLPSLWGAAWLIRATIIADERGLRWRGVGHWRQASWQEVQDYYDEFSLNPQRAKAIIETVAGSIRLSENNYKNVPLLRDFVQTQAQWAKARQWDVKGLRPDIDWPYVFSYDTQSKCTTHYVLLLICTLWVGSGLWLLLANKQIFIDVGTYAGPAMMLAGLAVCLFFLALAPLVARITISIDREIQKRYQEKVTVSATELVFENASERIAIPWHEIEDYYCNPMNSRQSFDDHYVVVGQKASFDFTLIHERYLLVRLISQLATQTPFQQWRKYYPSPEAKNVTFNYRNTAYRAMLWIPSAFCPLFLLMAYHAQTSPMMADLDSPPPPHPFWIFGILAGMCCFWLWLGYYFNTITLTEQGIIQRGWYGEKSLAWSEIEELHGPGAYTTTYRIVGRGKRLIFGSMITTPGLLKKEIQRHAVNAKIHSSWNRTTT